jgi:hypothetical protein
MAPATEPALTARNTPGKLQPRAPIKMAPKRVTVSPGKGGKTYSRPELKKSKVYASKAGSSVTPSSNFKKPSSICSTHFNGYFLKAYKFRKLFYLINL